MSVVHVAGTQDPRLADYVGLTDAALHRTTGRFIAESTVVVRRALDAGHAPISFLVDERHQDLIAELTALVPEVPVFVGPSAALESLTGFHLHRGALGAFTRPELPSLETLLDAWDGAGSLPGSDPALPDAAGPAPARRLRLAVLEGLTEHTNVGAAFRSAAAFGVDAVLVTPRCADPLYRRSIRVSMGTVFQVPWTRVEDWPGAIGLLREHGFVVAGMTLGEGAVSLDELVARDPQRLALVLGNEGHGLSEATDAAVDVRVTIPMAGGVDSLNVAASAAVALYATR